MSRKACSVKHCVKMVDSPPGALVLTLDFLNLCRTSRYVKLAFIHSPTNLALCRAQLVRNGQTMHLSTVPLTKVSCPYGVQILCIASVRHCPLVVIGNFAQHASRPLDFILFLHNVQAHGLFNSPSIVISKSLDLLPLIMLLEVPSLRYTVN